MYKACETGEDSTEVIIMRKRNRGSMKKEKIIMLMSSAFVLSALTMTGFYVRERNAAGRDGYIVDLSEMEQQVTEKSDNIAVQQQRQGEGNVLENDLDYDPGLVDIESLQADSTDVENPGLESAQNADDAENAEEKEQESGEEETEDDGNADAREEEADAMDEEEAEAVAAVHFSDGEGLQWPIAGNVLLNFSMDKTIYFPTLQQYKYNPAIVIQAQEGANIVAAASGEVVSIYTDSETGQTIVMSLGDGYEVTYGQLENIQVFTGDYVEAGNVLGTVAPPTKYYSVEGSNVYFKLTRDGIPVNPLSKLG